MVYYCAFGCRNGGTTTGISFFKFPKSIPAKKEWIRRVSPSRFCALAAVCSVTSNRSHLPTIRRSPTTWCTIWQQAIATRCNSDVLSSQKPTGRTAFYSCSEKETWGLLGLHIYIDRLVLIFAIVERRTESLRKQFDTRTQHGWSSKTVVVC